jgi:hypothetical protein
MAAVPNTHGEAMQNSLVEDKGKEARVELEGH